MENEKPERVLPESVLQAKREGNTALLSALGKKGNAVKKMRKRIAAARTHRKHTAELPNSVLRAMRTGDHGELSHLGKMGAESRKRLARKKPVQSSAISRQERKELEDFRQLQFYFGALTKIRQAHEHICPVDD